MIDKIRKQIEKLHDVAHASRNLDGETDTLTEAADTMEKMLSVVKAADVLVKVFRSEIEQAKSAELVAQVLNDFYRERKALAALDQEQE